MSIGSALECGGLIIGVAGVLLSLSKDMFQIEAATSDPDIAHSRLTYRRHQFAHSFRNHLVFISSFLFLTVLIIVLSHGACYLLAPHIKTASLPSFQHCVGVFAKALVSVNLLLAGYVVCVGTWIRKAEAANLQG